VNRSTLSLFKVVALNTLSALLLSAGKFTMNLLNDNINNYKVKNINVRKWSRWRVKNKTERKELSPKPGMIAKRGILYLLADFLLRV
jgi:hypothetical protein